MESSTTTDALFSQGVHAVRDAFSLSTDLVIIAALFFVLLAAVAWQGRGSFAAFLLGVYIALPLYLNFTYLNRFLIWTDTPENTFLSHAILFGAFAIVGYLVCRRLVSRELVGRSLPGMLELLLLAAAGTGLLLAISYRIFPIDLFYNFGPDIDRFFAEPNLFFWWLLAPLLAIFFSTRR